MSKCFFRMSRNHSCLHTKMRRNLRVKKGVWKSTTKEEKWKNQMQRYFSAKIRRVLIFLFLNWLASLKAIFLCIFLPVRCSKSASLNICIFYSNYLLYLGIIFQFTQSSIRCAAHSAKNISGKRLFLKPPVCGKRTGFNLTPW